MPPSTWFLTAAILILITCWGFAIFNRKAGEVPRFLIVISGIVPALLVTLVMLGARDRFGDLRISLEGFRFNLDEMHDAEVFVGGDGKKDHLYVRDLPSNFLRFRPSGKQLEIAVANPFEEVFKEKEDGTRVETGLWRFGAVRCRTTDAARGPFHNAVPLMDGAKISIGTNQAPLVWDRKQQRFKGTSADGAFDSWQIEVRKSKFLPEGTPVFGKVDLPLLKNLSAQIRMFPLRHYGMADGDISELTSDTGEVLGSFFCWSGNLNQDPYLVLLDESVLIEQGGETTSYDPVIFRLPEDQVAHLTLYRLDYRDNRETKAVGFSRAQDRRSFLVSYKEGVVDITLDTPGFVHLEHEDLENLERQAEYKGTNESIALTLAEESLSRASSRHRMLLDFNVVGQTMSHEMFSAIRFPKKGHEIEVTTHTGKRGYRYGDGFLIGDKTALKLRIFKFNVPAGLLLVIWAASLAALFTGMSIRRQPMNLVLLNGLEFFLAFRILVAFEASTLNTGSLDGVWSSLVAFATAFYVLQGALILYRDKWRLRRPLSHFDPLLILHLALTLVLQAVMVWSVSGSIMTYLIIAALSLGAPFFLLFVFVLLDKLPFLKGKQFSPGGWMHWVIWSVVLLCGARIITMMVFGWKERMFLPGGPAMAVSIYYTPASLFILAMLWRARTCLGWKAVPLLWFCLGMLFVLLPILARDMGMLLIFSIPAMLLFAVPWFGNLRDKTGFLLALPLFLYIFAVHLLLPWYTTTGLSTSAEQTSDSADQAMAMLTERVNETHNDLRIWSQAAPDKLQEIGTTEAESLALVMANLRAYASRGGLGEGYMGTELSPVLRATQLNDNVSAIHVLAVYGGLGAAAFLLLLTAWSLAPLPLLRGTTLDEMFTPKASFGLMILLSFFASAMYMFSANSELVLFTGKNVYFLAATSNSDVVEGILLIALAAWAFHDIDP